jgi:hypothetical protein
VDDLVPEALCSSSVVLVLSLNIFTSIMPNWYAMLGGPTLLSHILSPTLHSVDGSQGNPDGGGKHMMGMLN